MSADILVRVSRGNQIHLAPSTNYEWRSRTGAFLGGCSTEEHHDIRACLTRGWLKYHHEGLHATLRLTDTGRRELGEAA